MLPPGHKNRFNAEFHSFLTVLGSLASKLCGMPFEREMNNECNDIQCFLIDCIKLVFIQYRRFPSFYLIHRAKKKCTIQSYL